MAEETDGLRRHFILDGVTETEPYRDPESGGDSPSKPPAQNRAQHGAALRRQIDELRDVAEFARGAQQAAGMEDGLGLQVEFESFPEIELAFESLARERSGIELLNVRHEDNRTHATVFVPDGKLDHFERLIREYLAEARDKAGHPSPQQEGLPALGPAMWIRCSGHRPGTVVRRELSDDGGRGASASFQTRRKQSADPSGHASS